MKPRPVEWTLVLAVAGTITTVVLGQQLHGLNARLDRLEQRQPTVVVHTVTTRDVSLPARASRSHARRDIPSNVIRGNRTHRWSVTAYCATGNRTASGLWPRVGMAATLDRSIPFGTRLRVPGAGVVVVQDRIGHGSDLDLYLGTGAACDHAARTWGRRTLTVTEVPHS